MDDPFIEAARDQLKESREWQQMNKQISDSIQRGLQRRDLSDFSEKEKNMLAKRATQEIKRTHVYTQLQDKAFDIVNQNFSEGQSDLTLSLACSNLLQHRLEFKHHLKRCINLPLPAPLRHVAWGSFLHDPLTREDMHLGIGELTVEKSLIQHCNNALQEKPLLKKYISLMPLFTQAMARLLKHWQIRTHNSGPIPPTTILLTVPILLSAKKLFINHPSSSRKQVLNSESLSSSAEIFVSFMDSILPVTVQNTSKHEVS